MSNNNFLILFEEKNTKILHPFCYFSSNKIIFDKYCVPINTPENPICKIKNKIFDEGIFKISVSEAISQELNTFFSNIGATNIFFIETIKIEIGSVKQFEELYGKLIIKTSPISAFS
jgi:hypothetical protein